MLCISNAMPMHVPPCPHLYHYLYCRSPVYIWRDGQFRLHQNIDSQQASDMETVDLNGNTWLTVATGNNLIN